MRIFRKVNQKIILVVIASFSVLSCSKDDPNVELTKQYLGNWKLESISPTIESIQNSKSCRLLNDNLFFNDTGTMYWTRAAKNSNGNYNQPCFDNIITAYDFKIINSELKLFDKDNGDEIDWSYVLNKDLLTINRIDTITIYKKVIE